MAVNLEFSVCLEVPISTKKSLLPRSIEGMTKTSTIFIGDIRPFATDHSYSVPAFPTADADSTVPNSVW